MKVSPACQLRKRARALSLLRKDSQLRDFLRDIIQQTAESFLGKRLKLDEYEQLKEEEAKLRLCSKKKKQKVRI